jgi:hypothetical protein
MKHIRILIFFTISILFYNSSSNAQCLDFAKSKGFAKLDTAKYVPEGRLNSIPLSEGDNMDVYKSFFRGRKYKIVVVGAENMPKIYFKVTNFQRQVLYDNKEHSNAEFWEFVSDQNQNLIISIEVPAAASGQPKTGCVAVIVGFQADF